MNCNLCKEHLEAYLWGNLSEGTKAQVKAHLEICSDCTQVYNLEILSRRVISEEKELKSNPFLSTRVMAGIEALEQTRKTGVTVPLFRRVLKPVLVAVSIAAAVFIGIMAGNKYQPSSRPENVPVELTYMDDAALESVNLLANN
jgi:predicted anti-sigma-YlaC factor YlaD